MTSNGAPPNWSRFGLDSSSGSQQANGSSQSNSSSEQQQQQQLQRSSSAASKDSETEKPSRHQQSELFDEDQSKSQAPWWKTNFLITNEHPVQFGTWDGVFTSCLINIFGVVIFLRTGWMVGNVGTGLALLIICMTSSIALIAVLSAIGVCERTRVQSGGVYFLLSHVLGVRIGAAIGIVYCFGQAVACSLYTVGFGESIADLIQNASAVPEHNKWIARGIAVAVVFLLLSINVAGVKWVIRLQLVLLVILLVGVLDFFVGAFVSYDPENGVFGFNITVWQENRDPAYVPHHGFFSVFGVFFPTATGVFAGINMSGDLRDARKSIPTGTLSAVTLSFVLYVLFALVLAATCAREFLQTDYMIAAKESLIYACFLAALYISSCSSSMTGLLVASRILLAISQDLELNWLTKTWGRNKVPLFSLLLITSIALIFVLVGNVNTLGPVVSMPFLITYASVSYSYFALAMSFDMQERRDARYNKLFSESQQHRAQEQSYGANNSNSQLSGTNSYRTTANGTYHAVAKNDLDQLFPERNDGKSPAASAPTEKKGASVSVGNGTGDKKSRKESDTLIDKSGYNKASVSHEKDNTEDVAQSDQITSQPKSFYSVLSNRWISLFGSFLFPGLMFLVNWIYALVCIFLVFLLYMAVAVGNPGALPGHAEFSLYEWVRSGVIWIWRGCPGGCWCCYDDNRSRSDEEPLFVPPRTPQIGTAQAQLTDENDDYAQRGRFHHSQLFPSSNFTGDEKGHFK